MNTFYSVPRLADSHIFISYTDFSPSRFRYSNSLSYPLTYARPTEEVLVLSMLQQSFKHGTIKWHLILDIIITSKPPFI